MNLLDPNLARMLGLTSSTRTENRENLTTAELEVRVALKRNRATLERKMYMGAGFIGGFALPKFVLR
jgi:hypothetical protein